MLTSVHSSTIITHAESSIALRHCGARPTLDRRRAGRHARPERGEGCEVAAAIAHGDLTPRGMSPDRSVRDLTERQREVLDYIVEVLRESGYPPTVREIANHFGMASAFGVQRHLEALQKKGFLRRETGARALTLAPSVLQALEHTTGALPVAAEAPPPMNATLVPVLGRVAAGIPITAEQNVDDMLALPDAWISGRGNVYLLRVKGDSMAPGIEDRDLVMVRDQASAENGAIVVACVDGEATVKRFFREQGRIVLRADNPMYADIVLTHDFRLNGRVIGVIRLY